jgi:RimJ/RimL family protein N-acetyltransferase
VIPELETERLLLRGWNSADIEPFANLNSDPKVMAFFQSPLSKEQTIDYIEKANTELAREGFGRWALELKSTRELIGVIGVAKVDFETPFKGLLGIGWRLSASHWGNGYAPEGARAAADFMFRSHRCTEIVAFTPVENTASRRVMEKMGMRYDPNDDFDHPKMPVGHALRRHVLYRLPSV